MASRRDETGAQAFARRRAVDAFLRARAGSGAPRPVRTLVPGLVAAALLLAGYGLWGLIRPAAPPGWDEVGAKVLVGSESTTRYVVLRTGGTVELHPVLNLASARLLLDPSRYGVLMVDERVLDDGHLPHGATLGIPYAPDRLPGPADAGTAKVWSVCEQPGPDGSGSVDKAAFVLAARDADRVAGRGRLTGDQALYVQGPDGTRYLVDAHGTRHPLSGTAPDTLAQALFGGAPRPQPVTADWLATLPSGPALDFPRLPADPGSPAGVSRLDADTDRVGMVLAVPDGDGAHYYVVLPGKVAPVTELTARLLLADPDTRGLYGDAGPAARPVPAAELSPAGGAFGDPGLPSRPPRQVNTGRTDTVCGVYQGTADRRGRPRLGVWASGGYPVPLGDPATGAYVTPGSGLLYRETGDGAASGLFLVTDTGLRYAVPSGGDDLARLGYAGVTPRQVPAAWSAFLSAGPALDTGDALRTQGW